MKAETSKPKATAKVKTTAAKPAAAKVPAKTAAAKVPAKTAAAKVPAKTAAAKVPAKAAARAVPKVEPVKAVVQPVGPDQVPVRSTRPSSRLAQLTVPSIAQSAASNAAKASYTNTLPSTMQVVAPVAPAKKDAALANNWKSKPADELSDAEVLAMPDSEYMNAVQMAFFRHKLVLLKQEIHASAGQTTENLREDTVVVPDPADRATIEEEHALELRTRDRERKLLKKIEQSINLIDAGEYGYCDETGEPIGVGRLIARPTATLSLEAQQRRELKQKMFGD